MSQWKGQERTRTAQRQDGKIGNYVGTATESKKLNVEQYAHHLGVHSSTIWKLIHKGQIPHFRIGRVIRIDVAEADAALRADAHDA